MAEELAAVSGAAGAASSPDPGAGGTGGAAAPAAASVTAPGLAEGAATASGVPSGQAGTGQASPEYMGVREALAGYGIDLRQQFQDDHAALQHLALAYRQAQQANHLAQYGQVYLQHADQFNAWLRQQQDQARQQQSQQAQWWKAPEYDPSWASKLTRDPQTGEIRAVPGADPSLVNKYLTWAEHQRGFLERFSQDPIKAIQPGIEQIARQVAQEMVQQHLGTHQERTSARGFVEANSSWIHARDPQGNLLYDPSTNKPALSPLGQRFAAYVSEAQKRGIYDVDGQQDYALAKVQRDYLLAQQAQGLRGQQAQQQGEAAKQQFLQQAQQRGPGGPATQPNVNGSVTPSGSGGQMGTRRALEDAMLKEFAAAGFQPGQKLF